MCGIVGYIGSKNATDILVDGLRKLEYRGYDSSGIAVFDNDKIEVRKQKGRLDDLEFFMTEAGRPCGTCGIGHTRWATHGEPSNENSHPHSVGMVTIVHNGIIENYIQIKEKMIKNGYEFKSETDTETVAALLDFLYDGDEISTISKAVEEIRGSYALGIIFKNKPNTIYSIRKDSPLIVGLGDDENFIASDIPAILKHTKKYYLMEENEIAIIKRSGVLVVDLKGNTIKKEVFEATWDIEAAEKGGYPHFMIKEINEEPRALIDTLNPIIKNDLPFLSENGLTDEKLCGFSKVYIIGCGTAMHAGLVGKYAIEKLARVPVDVCIASEFRYSDPILTENDLVMIISQSGETADSIAAMRLAKEKGAFTLGVVNVIGSTIAREADATVFTRAGVEIAVASTKAYTVQSAVMYALAIRFAMAAGKISGLEAKNLTSSLLKMPEIVKDAIEYFDGVCKDEADKNLTCNDLFFIGRGLDYYLCMEGSLKLKEISYIHSEAYAAGELKHGTISLVTDGVPVIAVATQKPLFEKMLGNIKEVKARGARVLLVARKDREISSDVYDSAIYVPDIDDLFMPLVCGSFIQLLAYYTSVKRGCDVDKPRNLAKSVTVE